MNGYEHLYIIGNGFDKHHGIKSDYSDFEKWLQKNNQTLHCRLSETFIKQKQPNEYIISLWSNFEEELGNLSLEQLVNNYVSTPLLVNDNSCIVDYIILKQKSDNSNFEPIQSLNSGDIGYCSLSTVFNNLSVEFSRWINDLIICCSRDLFFEYNSLFLCFNYTNTLEYVYNITPNDILHIHGCEKKNDKLIFGHNKTKEEIIQQLGSALNDNIEKDIFDSIVDAYTGLRKDCENIITMNQNFWKKLNNVKYIHIWGLSISKIDLPYIKFISKIVNNNAFWEVSFFNDDDIDRYKNIFETELNINTKNYKIDTLINLGKYPY